MKLFLVFLLCPFLADLTEGELFAEFPPETKQCWLWHRMLDVGDKYKPFAKNEHDECFEAFCDVDTKTQKVILHGNTCSERASSQQVGKCRMVAEPGVYPVCCPQMKCKDSWE